MILFSVKSIVLALIAFLVVFQNASAANCRHLIELSYVSQKVVNFKDVALPFMEMNAERNFFIGVGGLRVNYFLLKSHQPKGVIIISPGRAQASLSYAEIIYDLKDMNYDIYIIDHRGQGFSERILDDSQKGHVNDFADYVSDFTYFVNSVVRPEKYKKSIILSHSMGSTISAGFMNEYPHAVSQHVMVAPLFQIQTPVGQALTKIITAAHRFVGLKNDYVIGAGPFNANVKFDLATSDTNSKARFYEKNYLYARYPELKMGGTTNRWVETTLTYTKYLRSLKNLFQVPTIIFQAGKDAVVDAQAQNIMCMNSSQACKVIKVPDSNHSMLHESDDLRSKLILAIKAIIVDSE